MAQSRLEKIGTIFTRVTGLLRSGAMKTEDKPIWYDVYAAFPPKLEPRYDRPAPNIEIRDIFYEEDVVRAKYHKSVKFIDMVNLNDTRKETQCQQFIKIHNGLREQGPLDAEQIFSTAKELLAERRSETRQEAAPFTELDNEPQRLNLSQDFAEAKNKVDRKPTTENDKTKTAAKVGVSIESLFKE